MLIRQPDGIAFRCWRAENNDIMRYLAYRGYTPWPFITMRWYLINSSQDGVPLLQHAARMAEENGMRITIAHISTDYRALNYVSDSLRDDRVSQEVIQAKALLNELACTVSLPVDTLSLVTTRRFEDVETCVRQRQIDLIIAGHHNRLLGVLSSHSLEYINHLNLDVLIKHLP